MKRQTGCKRRARGIEHQLQNMKIFLECPNTAAVGSRRLEKTEDGMEGSKVSDGVLQINQCQKANKEHRAEGR